MRHLDLFSGIGGFALAAQWVWGEEYENVGFCDNNKFCQQVIKKNFKNAKIYSDIRDLDGTEIKNLDLLTGGFPCQPFSFAGKRRSDSQRAYGRGIHEDDQLSRRSVLSSVQAKRGKTRGKVGANPTPSPRDFTHTESAGQQSWAYGPGKIEFWGSGAGYDWLEVATSLCRVDDGFPARLDGRELTAKQHRIERIKALGNAIVPQVAAEILASIKKVDT